MPSPSPSVKIQIIGGKFKHCWIMSANFFLQKFVDNAQQCFAFTPQANFPTEFSLKVMGSNPDYLIKSFLFYL